MHSPRCHPASASAVRLTIRFLAVALAAGLTTTALAGQAPSARPSIDGYARGDAFLTAGQYRSALAEFEALRKLDPADARALIGLGSAQEGLGRGNAAQRSYQEYITLRPMDAVGYASLGHVLGSMGRNEEALQAYRSAQRLSPASAAATRGAGITLQALGRHEEALRALRAASRLDGRDPTIWGALALVSIDLERGADAASYWEAALHRDAGYFDRRPDERKKWERLMVTVGPRPAPDDAAASPPAAPIDGGVATAADRTGRAARGLNQPAGHASEEAAPSGFGSGSTSSGSGFVVSRERGFVLTNKHVVRGCGNVKVRFSGGESRPATVRALDPDDDLAIIETRLPNGPSASFRDDPAVRPGDDIVAVGYPLNGLLADQVNVSTGSVNALAGLYNDLHVLQMSAPVQPGSSGGALFDASGNVVGVVVTKLNAKLVADETGDIPQNVNFAVKAAIAREFLRAQGIPFRSAPSTARRSNADVGEIGRQVTVLVECWK